MKLGTSFIHNLGVILKSGPMLNLPLMAIKLINYNKSANQHICAQNIQNKDTLNSSKLIHHT